MPCGKGRPAWGKALARLWVGGRRWWACRGISACCQPNNGFRQPNGGILSTRLPETARFSHFAPTLVPPWRIRPREKKGRRKGERPHGEFSPTTILLRSGKWYGRGCRGQGMAICQGKARFLLHPAAFHLDTRARSGSGRNSKGHSARLREGQPDAGRTRGEHLWKGALPA